MDTITQRRVRADREDLARRAKALIAVNPLIVDTVGDTDMELPGDSAQAAETLDYLPHPQPDEAAKEVTMILVTDMAGWIRQWEAVKPYAPFDDPDVAHHRGCDPNDPYGGAIDGVLRNAPTWAEVGPRFNALVRGRPIIMAHGSVAAHLGNSARLRGTKQRRDRSTTCVISLLANYMVPFPLIGYALRHLDRDPEELRAIAAQRCSTIRDAVALSGIRCPWDAHDLAGNRLAACRVVPPLLRWIAGAPEPIISKPNSHL